MPYIESRQNPRIKNLVKLRNKSHRLKQQLFIIEGEREIKEALQSKVTVVEFYTCLSNGSITLKFEPSTEVFEVSESVFKKISYRENHDGHIAVARYYESQLTDLSLSKKPLILVLEDLEKPGNLGALIRTAEAAKVDAIICCQPHIDPFNPNVIRSSQGLIFHIPIITTDNPSCLTFLKKNLITPYVTNIKATQTHWELPKDSSLALILGSEKKGLSSFWLQNPHTKSVGIPMWGRADSLNLSVAASILIYECRRPRDLKSK